MMLLLNFHQKFDELSHELMQDRWRGVGRIVCSWDGTPLHKDTPSKQWRKFADKNGFTGLRFHELRHTHATLLLAGNQDAVTVASRLGHGNASTTLRNDAHALAKKDQFSADLMQKLMDRAMNPNHEE